MITKTEQLNTDIKICEVNQIADQIQYKYLDLANENEINFTDYVMQWEKETDPTMEEYDKRVEEYHQKWDIYKTYFMLYVMCGRYAHCGRRSWKMQNELDDAVDNARRLGLTVF